MMAVCTPVTAQWIEFVDVTSTALNADPALVADDLQEKDYAWGDLDQDGDVDLVIVRKEPWTTFGKFRNVLLINESGVLTDRTAEFASSSDHPFDNGFLTPTNDRDVTLVDVDLDGWLDIVIAATLGEQEPKYLGHPRVYRNLGCSGACASTDDWLGFMHEDARIPAMLTSTGVSGWNPRFCAVSAGDLTGDGYPDLYFADYDQHVGDPPPEQDFNDRLLVNQGTLAPGFFFDATAQRFSGEVPGVPQAFDVSDFGTANDVIDLNNDGMADIVKANSLVNYYVGIASNNALTPGFFDEYSPVIHGAPYFVSTGDLNNDDWADLVVMDDGADRYFLNQQAPGGVIAEFLSYPFSYSHDGEGPPPSDEGFGGNTLAADLDGDGWEDVLIADVDPDLDGCHRRLHIFRNLGVTIPGSAPTLQEQTTGSACALFNGNTATCIVASIPANKLIGVHDMAVFDINGDGWNDMIVGRCTGTQIYAQVPPGPKVGGTPNGADLPGQQLILDKSQQTALITLTWGESCSLGDNDYAVYEGALDSIGTQSPVVCSTSGATTHAFEPVAQDSYYLIVPTNGIAEGDYGRDSNGLPRSRSAGACYPQNDGGCDE